MKQTFILLSVLLLTAGSCNKDKNKEPELPPYTQTGKNVIAWRMDGKVYLSEGTIFLYGHRSKFGMTDSFSRLWITGQTDSPRFELWLTTQYKGLGMQLPMAEHHRYRGQIFDFSNGTSIPSGSNMYQTDSTHTGTVTVTYYDSSIIAGYFQMDVVNEAGEVKHITDGRFDIGPD